MEQMDRGSGPQRSGEPLDASGPMPSPMPRERDAALSSGGKLVVERSPSEECFYESVPSTSLIGPIASAVLCGNRAWHQKQRRLCSSSQRCPSSLAPPASVKQKPLMLGPMRWVDVAGRALRRTWMIHWRSQYVEVIPLVEIPNSISPPLRPPRAVRSHYCWSWHDRLARNAWWGPRQLRITVAGVPAFLAVS